MTPLDCPFCDRWLVFPATSFSTVWSPRIGKTGTQLATGCWIIRIFIWYREFWYHRGLLKKINEGLGRYDVFFPLWFAMTCLKDVLCADQITLECLRPVPSGFKASMAIWDIVGSNLLAEVTGHQHDEVGNQIWSRKGRTKPTKKQRNESGHKKKDNEGKEEMMKRNTNEANTARHIFFK